MTLRVDVQIPGSERLGVLEISGTDARLTDEQAAMIQRRRKPANESSERAITRTLKQPTVYHSSTAAIREFAYWVSLLAGEPQGIMDDKPLYRYVPDLLRSDEALVPHFNSPPSAWAPLRVVAEQASAIGLGVTVTNVGVPTMVGAYIGGLFLVKFVAPVVSEAGHATAAGVGARIRAAFGVETPGVVGPQAAEADSAAPSGGTNTDAPEGGADTPN
ncbi:hypothetical protein [Streptomyces sviceus]|uniref:hypothetical protein n=1 Tax=Streptomyces sviceus TaxID=285530 RepID=UPI003694AE81